VQGNQVQLNLRDVAEGMYLIAIEGKNSKEVVRISVVH